MRNNLIHTLLFALVYLASNASQAQVAGNSGYAPVDGLNMYFEIHGHGQPLILIHGGLGSGDMFSAIIPELSKDREVITVDLQAHGRTADIDRPISYEAIADDVSGIIPYLRTAPPVLFRSSIRLHV